MCEIEFYKTKMVFQSSGISLKIYCPRKPPRFPMHPALWELSVVHGLYILLAKLFCLRNLI